MTPEKVIEKTIDELSVLWERMTDSRDENIFVGDIQSRTDLYREVEENDK